MILVPSVMVKSAGWMSMSTVTCTTQSTRVPVHTCPAHSGKVPGMYKKANTSNEYKNNTQTQNIDHKSLVENDSGKASTANPKFASKTMFSPLSSRFARSFSSMDK